MVQAPKNHNKFWTDKDDIELIKFKKDGKSNADIATHFGRTPRAIACRIKLVGARVVSQGTETIDHVMLWSGLTKQDLLGEVKRCEQPRLTPEERLMSLEQKVDTIVNLLTRIAVGIESQVQEQQEQEQGVQEVCHQTYKEEDEWDVSLEA